MGSSATSTRQWLPMSGNYLRATASYTDPQNDPATAKKTANKVTGQIGASNAEPTFSDGAMTATRTLPENSARRA